MRAVVAFVVLLAFLSLLAPPTPVSADLDARVKKLEDELKTIKETSKAILAKLETSVLDNLPGKAQQLGQSLYNAVMHHGSNTAATVQKEYPKWLSFAQSYTKDLPAAASKTFATVQKEGTKHYVTGTRALSSFLANQGVPQQYITYITIGVMALLAVATALITLALLSSILTAVCCCGGRKRPTNAAIKRKNDKKAVEQHQQHKENIAKQQPLPKS